MSNRAFIGFGGVQRSLAVSIGQYIEDVHTNSHKGVDNLCRCHILFFNLRKFNNLKHCVHMMLCSKQD